MKKKVFVALGCSFLFLIGCSPDYVKMCQETYKEINDLPCIKLKPDDKFHVGIEGDYNEMCPNSYNETGYDYEDFFECIKENYKCECKDKNPSCDDNDKVLVSTVGENCIKAN